MTHTVFMPRKPTGEMLRILVDPESPYIARMRIDKKGYEVVFMPNEDWRTTVPAKHKRISRHRSWSAADHRAQVETAKWKYAQLMELGG